MSRRGTWSEHVAVGPMAGARPSPRSTLQTCTQAGAPPAATLTKQPGQAGARHQQGRGPAGGGALQHAAMAAQQAAQLGGGAAGAGGDGQGGCLDGAQRVAVLGAHQSCHLVKGHARKRGVHPGLQVNVHGRRRPAADAVKGGRAGRHPARRLCAAGGGGQDARVQGAAALEERSQGGVGGRDAPPQRVAGLQGLQGLQARGGPGGTRGSRVKRAWRGGWLGGQQRGSLPADMPCHRITRTS